MSIDLERILKRRLLDISYKHKLSHIGSCWTALPIILNCYLEAKEDDIFILSSGHAGLALYVVLESLYGIDAEKYLTRDGIHPVRGKYIDYSTGSLGLGLAAAVGFALATHNRTVRCLISDGECAEGIVWEALRISKDIPNLNIICNANGYSAYSKVSTEDLKHRIHAFNPNVKIEITDSDFEFMKGLKSHYHVMTKEDYETALLSVS